ncbi:MAG: DUF5615 family PIN-like protein [Pseudomonadota bacterium]
MRIRADEHVAPAIVQAINDLAIAEGFELTSVLRTGFGGTTDVHWITAFAADGGDAILTADTDFLKQPPQVLAIERTGLKVIHLPAGWANATRAVQAGHLLIWWRRIETQLQAMKKRECFTTHFAPPENAALKKVTLDFQGMGKKAKKAAKRDTR